MDVDREQSPKPVGSREADHVLAQAAAVQGWRQRLDLLADALEDFRKGVTGLDQSLRSPQPTDANGDS